MEVDCNVRSAIRVRVTVTLAAEHEGCHDHEGDYEGYHHGWRYVLRTCILVAALCLASKSALASFFCPTCE